MTAPVGTRGTVRAGDALNPTGVGNWAEAVYGRARSCGAGHLPLGVNWWLNDHTRVMFN